MAPRYFEFGIRPVVLVVEDDARLLQAKRELLEEFGFRTIGVAGYTEALAELSSNELDLVVVDLNLDSDEKSGLSLATEVKRLLPRLPLVGYSALFSHPGITTRELAVFDNYLANETDSPREFIARLSSWFDLAAKHARERGMIPEEPSTLVQLDKYAIGPRSAKLLIDEFETESAFLVLAPVIKDLGLSETLLADIMATLRRLKYTTHEKEPVCTAILVPKSAETASRLGELFVRTSYDATITDVALLRSLAQLVNGFDGTIIVLPTGHVLGAVTYPDVADIDDVILPDRYGPPAMASRVCQGLLVLFAGNGRVECLVRGARAMSHRNGTWRINPLDLRNDLRTIASEHGVPLKVLEAVLRVALALGDQGFGALLCLGDHDAVLKLADPPKERDLLWSVRSILDRDLRAIMALARQDGAVVISDDGKVVRGMVLLRPAPNTPAIQEAGTGARHDTAAKIATATNAVVVTVSVDGRLTVYSRGQLRLRLFG